MTRSLRVAFFGMTLVSFVSVVKPAAANERDPAAARALLQKGYALKNEHKLKEALEALRESLRLDEQAKTLLNMADCEDQLGLLTRAEEHLIRARDLASLHGPRGVEAEARRRLSALEERMPRLTVNQTGAAEPGVEVRRDGVLLAGSALGTPLPTDPGTHRITVTAPGRTTANFDIALNENEAKSIDVAPGPALPMAVPPSPGASIETATPPPPLQSSQPAASKELPPPARPVATVPAAPQSETDSAGPAAASGFWSAQRVAAVGTVGAGVVGLGVAAVSWVRATSLHNQASATCKPTCTPDGRDTQAAAVSAAHLSTGVAIAGGALVALGGVLWFTAPSTSGQRSLVIAPAATANSGGVVAVGRF